MASGDLAWPNPGDSLVLKLRRQGHVDFAVLSLCGYVAVACSRIKPGSVASGLLIAAAGFDRCGVEPPTAQMMPPCCLDHAFLVGQLATGLN